MTKQSKYEIKVIISKQNSSIIKHLEHKLKNYKDL